MDSIEGGDRPFLTVLIPCFNEALILRATADRLTAYLDAGAWAPAAAAWEVLFVDDGSTDRTRVILKDLSRRDARMRCVSYPMNAGQGRALQTGFEHAHGEWIVCIDADLDYGPEHISALLAAAAATGADIVVGSVYMPGGTMTGVPPTRAAMSRLMNWYFRKVIALQFSTYTSILRLYRRAMIQDLLLTSHDKDILPEILIKASLIGTPIVEVPAHLKWRETGDDGRSGASPLATARKAIRHLRWGAMENPLLFFLLPASAVGLGTLWFGFALVILFARAYARSGASGLAAVTAAANMTTLRNPQTVISFAVFLTTGLLIFSLSMIILQNKIKRDQDFIYLSRLFRERIRR